MIPISWIWQPTTQKRPFAIIDNQINIRDGYQAPRPEMTTIAIERLKIDEGLARIDEGLKKVSAQYIVPYPDCIGVPTQGYGTTIDPYSGAKITLASPPITKLEALDWLMHGLKVREDEVRKVVSVPLNNNQFSAIMSLVYNVGVYAFRQSTLLKKLNKADYKGAAREFKRWNKGMSSGNLIVLPGLTKRRKYEERMFLTKPLFD
ncbi:lysozyme [Candidatus Pacearchaeota archaeon]|nr:lysozyme [Candidatus Pacearchaeota archaeon]